EGIEGGFLTEKAGHEKVKEGPELAEMIFEGGSGETEPVGRRKGAGGLGGPGLGILDVLGLVENDAVPGRADEDCHIPGEKSVGGDDQMIALKTGKMLGPLR